MKLCKFYESDCQPLEGKREGAGA